MPTTEQLNNIRPETHKEILINVSEVCGNWEIYEREEIVDYNNN